MCLTSSFAIFRNTGAATRPPYPGPSSLGSSTITEITTRGRWVGKKPEKDAVCLSLVYDPLTSFLVVPVFPETMKPSSAARLAVPSEVTTPVIISPICLAASMETTRLFAFGLKATTVLPSLSVILLITCGCINIPKLAIVDTALCI